MTLMFMHEVGQYELIGDDGGYASVGDAVASTCSEQRTARIITATTDGDAAAEPTYVAVAAYTKRKSGEVNLQPGSTVSVLQTELSGKG